MAVSRWWFASTTRKQSRRTKEWAFDSRKASRIVQKEHRCLRHRTQRRLVATARSEPYVGRPPTLVLKRGKPRRRRRARLRRRLPARPRLATEAEEGLLIQRSRTSDLSFTVSEGTACSGTAAFC